MVCNVGRFDGILTPEGGEKVKQYHDNKQGYPRWRIGRHVLEHYQARKRASHSVRKVSCGGTLMMSLMLSSCAGAESGDGFPDRMTPTYGEVSLNRLRRSDRFSGMTKDQVRHLLGSPHFAEGRLNAQRWDYLFDLSGDARLVPGCASSS